jgi:2-polyprenyl-3-methyl-5-hydroxy-6-metoxy-1,4-benzoquinol methylase
MSSRDERSARAQFSERYATPSADVSADIERRVIGAVWGVNGYTTLEQADEIGRLLDLGPGRRLLDVGTGRGWPGLHLAQTTGCTVVGTDMPIVGLAVAVKRARAEGIEDRAAMVSAAGAHQPFRAGSFDAVVLTDVLC